ncbi:MAG: hypothetical protein MH204_05225, partial [Fimbriimonadaceae bacterium]|nr:hypothetical protein [Fimbriimonadaceae bacterium]
MLTAALLASATLGAQTLDARIMRWPTVHGDTVVFTYAGDLWTCDLEGGIARRLTSFPGEETRARFSPDGKTIAFTGQIDGGSDVFVIPAEGGEPTRLTYDLPSDNVMGWTPDGRIAYTSATQNTFTQRLWFVSPRGGQPQPTNVGEITDGSISPDGSTVAFNRVNSHNYNWRRYRGGTQGRISFFNLRTGEYSELPSGREQSYFPMYAGESVFFISDKNNNAQNLYRFDTKSRRTEQLTRFSDGDIKFPSTDGKSIIWQRLGKVEKWDIGSKELSTFTPRILADGLSTRP